LAKVANSSELEQLKAMDRLISRCKVTQRSQRKVCVRKERRRLLLPVSSFHIRDFYLGMSPVQIKTGKTMGIWNNSRQLIGLFQRAK